MNEYRAAVVILENTLNEFPDTDYREELLFLAVKANYKLAEGSIQIKKKERYQNTIDAYYTYIDEFANTKNSKEATRIYDDVSKKIKK
jgi:outer membrane protein assembly factor BamD